MIRTTPFHDRLSELNSQGLYTHWQGFLSPLRYTTAPAGAALLGTGAAVLVGGVIMVVLGRRADKRALAGQRTAVRPHGLGLRF